jgi:hypothetical protein
MQRRMQKLLSLFSDEDRQIQQGKALEKLGQKEEALELYTQLVAGNPGCKVCRYHMGRVAGELNHDDSSHCKKI